MIVIDHHPVCRKKSKRSPGGEAINETVCKKDTFVFARYLRPISSPALMPIALVTDAKS